MSSRALDRESAVVERVAPTAGDYGFDGPHLIVGFALGAFAAAIAAAVALGGEFETPYATVGGWVLVVLAVYGIFVLSMSIYYSKVGKIRFAEWVTKRLELRGDERVLDVGCGRGLYLNLIAKRLTSGRAYGIDIWQAKDLSGNSREAALLNAELEGVRDRVEPRDGDVRRIPHADDFFDVVVTCLAVHNVPSKEGREQAIREIARVTRPGGRVVLMDFVFVPTYARTLRQLGWREVMVTGRYLSTYPPSLRMAIAVKPPTEQGSREEPAA